MPNHHRPRPISLTGAPLAKFLRHRACLAEVNPFFLFPIPFSHCHKSPPPPSMSAGAELLPAPFRPSPSLPLLSTTLPGCALLGNTLRRQRHCSPSTGALTLYPSPSPPSLLLLDLEKKKPKERRKKEEGETEKLYRQMRRREQDRLARMDADYQKRKHMAEFELRREERLKEAEERTAKKRLKRQKKKQRKKEKKRAKTSNGGEQPNGGESSGGDEDSDDEDKP
uniref:Uncharacterized protein n=1 Tax=Oryza glumipatula TaxID=40148 RepID=A0A0E0AZ88_9ORYZ